MYCLGLFIMALGVTFSVKSALGVSPVTSLAHVVSLITRIDLGIVKYHFEMGAGKENFEWV